jgi:hypothetical protein
MLFPLLLFLHLLPLAGVRLSRRGKRLAEFHLHARMAAKNFGFRRSP